jgi:hypothetical protein
MGSHVRRAGLAGPLTKRDTEIEDYPRSGPFTSQWRRPYFVGWLAELRHEHSLTVVVQKRELILRTLLSRARQQAGL